MPEIIVYLIPSEGIRGYLSETHSAGQEDSMGIGDLEKGKFQVSFQPIGNGVGHT